MTSTGDVSTSMAVCCPAPPAAANTAQTLPIPPCSLMLALARSCLRRACGRARVSERPPSERASERASAREGVRRLTACVAPCAQAAHAAFKAAAATWQPIEMTVQGGATAVFEDTPFMHIPHVAAQCFWQSEAKPNARVIEEPKPRAYLSLLLEILLTIILPFVLVLLCTRNGGHSKKGPWHLPGKPQP